MKLINMEDKKLLDYPEAVLLNQDTQMRIDSSKGSLYSTGKSFLMEEKESGKTNEKISTIRVNVGKVKHVLLDIVHGIDEDISNLFHRTNRYSTSPNKGIILTILPALLWMIGFMFWFSFYEGMIKKRIPLMTSTTITIISLTGIIAFIITIVIMLFFSREDTFTSNMAVTGESKRMITYYFEGKLDVYEATVYEGFLWNQSYTSKRIFNLKLLGSIFGDLEQKRREKIIELKNIHYRYTQLDSELREIPNILKGKRALLDSKSSKHRKVTHIVKQIEVLEKKETAMQSDIDELVTVIREKRNETIAYIKTLNSNAITEWKKVIKKMGIDNALEIEIKQILRMDEKIADLEKDVSKYQMLLTQKEDTISAMMEVNVETTKSIKDVAMTGTEDASARIKMAKEYKDNSLKVTNSVNWNTLLKQATPWIFAVIMGLILLGIINGAKDYSKTAAIIWMLGISISLAIVASIFSLIANQFRVKPSSGEGQR